MPHATPIALTALLLLAGSGFGQPVAPGAPGADLKSSLVSSTPTPPNIEGKRNAALAYYQLGETFSREKRTAIQVAWDAQASTEDATLPDEATRALLKESAHSIERIVRITEISECDWGIQYQDGFGTLLPHLGTLRSYARLLSYDAARCLAEGDKRGATDRYAAIYRLSKHGSTGDVLICSLVGVAIEARVQSCVKAQLDAGRIDVEMARTLLNAARGNVGEDTHRFRASLDVEAYMALDWVKGHYTGPNAGKQFVADMGDMQNEQFDDPALLALDGDALAGEVEKTRPYYDAVRRVWGTPEAPEKLAALSKEVGEGKFGKFTHLLAAFDKSHHTMLKTKAQLEEHIKILEAFIRGEYVPGQATKPEAAAKVPAAPAASPAPATTPK
jgi:hypothetical protein